MLLTIVTFDNNGSTTTVRLTMVPLDATATEIAFAGAMAGMDNGWGKAYAILEWPYRRVAGRNAS